MSFIRSLFEDFNRKNKKHIAIALFAVIFAFGLLTIILGEVVLFIAKPRLIDPALNCSANNVISIEITKEHNKVASLLTDDKISFNDHDTISKLCIALKGSERFSPDHPKKKWSCVMKIKTNKHEYSLHVIETKNRERNGTIIQFWSNVTWGWRIGRFKSDHLGPVLEKVAPFLKQ